MIDAHAHVWTLDTARYPFQPTLSSIPPPSAPATVEELLAAMDEAGVESAVLVQTAHYGWDNGYLAACVERDPARLAGVCLVDPRAADAAAALESLCRSHGFAGARINLIEEEDAGWLARPPAAELVAAAARLGVPLLLQALAPQAPAVAALAEAVPGATIVVDYLGAEAFHGRAGRDAIDRLAAQPSVVFKLLSVLGDSREGAPYRDLARLYAYAVERFGTARLLLGSDFPYVRAYASYADAIAWLRALDASGELEHRCDETARRLFRLGARPAQERGADAAR